MSEEAKQEAKKKDEARRAALLLLAIGFAIADRVGGAPARSVAAPFEDAKAFLDEADDRGLDPSRLA